MSRTHPQDTREDDRPLSSCIDEWRPRQTRFASLFGERAHDPVPAPGAGSDEGAGASPAGWGRRTTERHSPVRFAHSRRMLTIRFR
jgi:hypothetical protein